MNWSVFAIAFFVYWFGFGSAAFLFWRSGERRCGDRLNLPRERLGLQGPFRRQRK